MRNLCSLILVGILSSACTMTDWLSEGNNLNVTNTTDSQYQSNVLHSHVEKLARQLFNTAQLFNTSNTIAVGTILPAMQRNGGALPHESALSIQIQESLMTFSTQAGLKVIEYKTMPSIKIDQYADKMLSREVSELQASIEADYFLTGTYTLQENDTIVNIRLIQIPENIVLAAATDYVPNDVMWSSSKVTIRNNQIYRGTH